MSRVFRIGIVGVLVGAVGCATAGRDGLYTNAKEQFLNSAGMVLNTSDLRLHAGEREELRRRLVGKELVTVSSLQTAVFFDRDGVMFADNRPQSAIQLFNRKGDELVAPELAALRIPIGTAVRIKSLVFPPDINVVRAVWSGGSDEQPTGHPWMVLERSDRKNSPPLVVVLPREIQSIPEFEGAVRRFVATADYVRPWLKKRKPRRFRKIDEKTPVVGMTRSELEATIGRAINADDATSIDAVSYTLDYGDFTVAMRGHVAQSIDDKPEPEPEPEPIVEPEPVVATEPEPEPETEVATVEPSGKSDKNDSFSLLERALAGETIEDEPVAAKTDATESEAVSEPIEDPKPAVEKKRKKRRRRALKKKRRAKRRRAKAAKRRRAQRRRVAMRR